MAESNHPSLPSDAEQQTAQEATLEAKKQKRKETSPVEQYVNHTVQAFRDYVERKITEDDMRGILLRREARDLQPFLEQRGLHPELALPRGWYRSQWFREDNAALPENERLTAEQIAEKDRQHEALIDQNIRDGTTPPIPYFESEEYRGYKAGQQRSIEQAKVEREQGIAEIRVMLGGEVNPTQPQEANTSFSAAAPSLSQENVAQHIQPQVADNAE